MINITLYMILYVLFYNHILCGFPAVQIRKLSVPELLSGGEVTGTAIRKKFHTLWRQKTPKRILYYFGRFAQALRMTGINAGGMTPILGNGLLTVTLGDASNHTSLKGSF